MPNYKEYSPKIILYAAIAPGIYPIIFFYSRNYPLVNTWEHLAFFLGTFILIPLAIFFLAMVVSRWKPLWPFRKYILPFLNVFTLLYLLKVCYYIRIEKDKILIAAVIAGLIALLLHKHLLKLIFLEIILAIIGTMGLIQTIHHFVSIDTSWLEQPDNIAEVQFQTKPSVYLIQADGYANFSELKKPNYAINTNEFESFLKEENFKFYPNYRSNYSTTVESNVTLFNMKHHYYNGSISYNEIYNGRNMIISENPVLDAFKNNGYTTYFVSETPYLIANRPTMGFDVTNYPYSEVKFIRNGARRMKDVEPALDLILNDEHSTSKFFFIQLLNPWHISSVNNATRKVETEREKYVSRLEETNKILERIINKIKAKDNNALVILMSDHGGFVGMRHTGEKRTKNLDPDFQSSIFSSNLAISWPQNNSPEFDDNLRSSVNLFRVLFTYLSNNNSYLDHLQEDGSYLIINEGAEDGIYQTIDSNGKVVFKPLEELPF